MGQDEGSNNHRRPVFGDVMLPCRPDDGVELQQAIDEIHAYGGCMEAVITISEAGGAVLPGCLAKQPWRNRACWMARYRNRKLRQEPGPWSGRTGGSQGSLSQTWQHFLPRPPVAPA